MVTKNMLEFASTFRDFLLISWKQKFRRENCSCCKFSKLRQVRNLSKIIFTKPPTLKDTLQQSHISQQLKCHFEFQSTKSGTFSVGFFLRLASSAQSLGHFTKKLYSNGYSFILSDPRKTKFNEASFNPANISHPFSDDKLDFFFQNQTKSSQMLRLVLMKYQ